MVTGTLATGITIVVLSLAFAIVVAGLWAFVHCVADREAYSNWQNDAILESNEELEAEVEELKRKLKNNSSRLDRANVELYKMRASSREETNLIVALRDRQIDDNLHKQHLSQWVARLQKELTREKEQTKYLQGQLRSTIAELQQTKDTNATLVRRTPGYQRLLNRFTRTKETSSEGSGVGADQLRGCGVEWDADGRPS